VLVRHGLDVGLTSIYNLVLGLGLVNYDLGLDTYSLGLGALALTPSLQNIQELCEQN